MPAFDINQASASQTHDISAETTHNAAAVNLGNTGLPAGLYCTIAVTEVTAQAVGAVTFNFQVTVDNGTTWRNAGSIIVPVGKVAALSLFTFPVGFADLIPESKAGGDIDWRVASVIGATIANADDFSWIAYLGFSSGFAGPYN